MNVMYTCDNNYVWLMGISTISLFENNKHINDLNVYLLGEKISQENKNELKKIGNNYRRTVEIIDVPKLNISPSLVSTRWPLSAFTRLFSGELLPRHIDKILYLDCDTIILGDISELDNVEFNGNVAIGVKDCISGTYKRNVGLDKNSQYINAGVVLFNMQALRNVDIHAEIEAYMNIYMNFINYADQDILNGVFKGKIGELNPKFDVMTIDVSHTYEEIQSLRRPTNFYSKGDLEMAKSYPVIVHYTTNMLVVRPWFSNSNHPLKHEFERYMDMSVWKDKILNEMRFTTKEAKAIKVVMMLPNKVAYLILGLIHAEIKPRYIRARAKCL